MVSATHRLETLDPLAASAPSSSSTKTASTSEPSFARHLATVLDRDLDQGKSEKAGQTSGGSQFLVTDKVKTPTAVTPISSGPASTSTTTSTSTAASNIPTMLGMGPVAGTAPVQEQAAVATAPVNTAEETEADAYWNAQPVAVQALRNMPDGQAKDQLALSLANQGYSIDTQIMVWGWDPQMTMTIRENQGYSWVPSYGQANIAVGPGLSMPGDTNIYSPGQAPAGAIQVSTAFANGTIQNPLVQTSTGAVTG